MKTSKYILRLFILVIIAGTASIACDNSTGDDHDDEQEPVGFAIRSGGNVVVTQNNGTVTGTLDITVTNGGTFTVVFVDEDGDEFIPEIDEHSITVTVTGTLATVAIGTGNATTGYPFTFTATGVGTAQATLNLLHEGATEFVSQSITVNITQ